MKNNKSRWLMYSVIYIAITFSLLLIYLVFNIHPLGYEYEISENKKVVIVEKGVFNKEVHEFKLYKDNELKAALLRASIRELHRIWLINLSIIPAIVLSFILMFKSHVKLSRSKVYTILFLLFIFTALDIYLFSETFQEIFSRMIELNSLR